MTINGPIAVPDIENWNLDRTVVPATKVTGAMGKDSGGTWRYILVDSNGQVIIDPTNLDTRYLLQSLFTAKGSLITATASAVPAELTVGSNNQVLTADSAASKGIKWATPFATGQTYTASNVTTDRTYDANATTVDELADVLGTLIADLRAVGIVV